MSCLDRAAHRICASTPLSDSPLDALELRLSQAYALLQVVQLGIIDTNGEFGMMNDDIQAAAIGGVQHLIAEAHFELAQVNAARAREGIRDLGGC